VGTGAAWRHVGESQTRPPALLSGGVELRRKRRRRLLRLKPVWPAATACNQEWAIDFATDALASQRHLRILSIVDVFTRECLALETDTPLGSVRIIRALEQIMAERGSPQRIRTDNGPSSPAAASWPGVSTEGSSWFTSGPASLLRMPTWKAFTDVSVKSVCK